MSGEMKNQSGKLSPEALSRSVFGALGAVRPEVIVGPAVGEDAAVIRWPGEKLLVFAADPIVGAAKGAGKLLVRINVNDIASKGGEPAYIAVTLIFPPHMGESAVSGVMSEIHIECKRLGIAVVGGHTEFNDFYNHPVLSAALIGTADRAYVASDIRPGDVIFVTGHIGTEGMAILASDRPDLLKGVMSESETAEIEGWMEETSVLEESRLMRDHASFMHDPTEGGFWGGLGEICRLSGLSADIDVASAPLHEYTRRVSTALGFDPLSLVASGSLMAVVSAEKAHIAEGVFAESGVALSRVGRMTDRPYLAADMTAPPEELWGLLKRDLA
ncbi:MAG: hydrogenase expression protein [Synergistaceae bacterium]|jgi:hydrogenase maturation factor|nr:hydrogenase expression protein [Synergistaceae bacterium]